MSKLTVLTNLDLDTLNNKIDNEVSDIQSSVEQTLSDAKAYTDEKFSNVETEVSWDELTDKPFGEETETIVFVPEQKVEGFEYIEEMNLMSVDIELTCVADNSIFSNSDNTANVVWDGTLYESLEIKSFDGYTYYVGGTLDMNTNTIDFSEYPFAIILIDYDFAIHTSDTTSTSHNVSISINCKTNKPLDSKYLPEHNHSWNDLEDRPFGEEVTMGDTLVWDGSNSGSLESAYALDIMFYRISDAIVTLDDVTNGSITYLYDSNNNPLSIINLSKDEHVELATELCGLVCSVEACIICVPTDNFILAIEDEELGRFNKAGVYMTKPESMNESCVRVQFTIPGFNKFPTTTVEPLDPKYLPDTVASKEYVNQEIAKIQANINNLTSSIDEAVEELSKI